MTIVVPIDTAVKPARHPDAMPDFAEKLYNVFASVTGREKIGLIDLDASSLYGESRALC